MSGRRKDTGTGRGVDLDAARRARAEADDGDAPYVILARQRFDLPRRLPALVLVGLARARLGQLEGFEDALMGLFGERTKEALLLGLELDDFDAIIEGAYGDDPGEAAASAPS